MAVAWRWHYVAISAANAEVFLLNTQREMTDAHFKLVLVGRGGAGKSELLRMYSQLERVHDEFPADLLERHVFIASTNVEFKARKSTYQGWRCKFGIWDGPIHRGQDCNPCTTTSPRGARERSHSRGTSWPLRYVSMANLVAGVSGMMVLFDLSREGELEATRELLVACTSRRPPVPVLLVANKSDLEDARTVTPEDVRRLASSCKVASIETSASCGHNVSRAFEMLSRQVFNSYIAALRFEWARCRQLCHRLIASRVAISCLPWRLHTSCSPKSSNPAQPRAEVDLIDGVDLSDSTIHCLIFVLPLDLFEHICCVAYERIGTEV